MDIGEAIDLIPSPDDPVGIRITIDGTDAAGITRHQQITVNIIADMDMEEVIMQALEWAQEIGENLWAAAGSERIEIEGWDVATVVEGGFSNPALTLG